MRNNCPFCEPSPDRIIAQNTHAVAVWDEFPVSKGHALIVPKEHVADFMDLPHHVHDAMMSLMKIVRNVIAEKYHPAGYNVGVNCGVAAGQTVMHAHMHIIPRYTGDVLDPRGGVRGVIPDKQNYLNETHQ